jgi:UDP-N-acetyl-2-amino-2-deoxyglucuronate dehydrogenase
MRPVRFAVVGCGKIGVRHLAVLRAEPEAEIAAVCDIDSGVVRQQSATFGVPGFTDYRQMLRRTDCDVVNICTPHGLHAAMTVEAAAEGRHVLVEKPMALSERDAWAMIDAAARSGTHLMVVKQNRFNVRS